MKVVSVKPLNKRMKDRVNTHGSLFKVQSENNRIINNIKYDLLLESLSGTFKLNKTKWTTWSGWVRVGKDVEIVE